MDVGILAHIKQAMRTKNHVDRIDKNIPGQFRMSGHAVCAQAAVDPVSIQVIEYQRVGGVGCAYRKNRPSISLVGAKDRGGLGSAVLLKLLTFYVFHDK